MTLTKTEEIEYILLMEAELAALERRKLWTYFPDTGPLRRELYQKHLEFFRAGATHRQMLMLAANRIGKTESVGLYELSLHLTGRYPDWWEGRRFTHPIRAWAAGDTGVTVREILQQKLLGSPGAFGTGVLPGEDLIRTIPKTGVPEAVEAVRCKHHTEGFHDGDSLLIFKTYEQGRQAFQGTEQHVILLDEEPPMGVYTECLTRTMETATFSGGLLLLTFTPLLGMSEVVLKFLPDGRFPEGEQPGSTYVVNAGWDDVPHLGEKAKEELRKEYPAYQLNARTRGIPMLGAGAIYPVDERVYMVEPFAIPKHWLRAYGMDVGWNRTAGVWGAYDREADTWTLYHEYYGSEAEPSIHATALKAPGDWIHGVIDPAARGRSQHDGQRLMDVYGDKAYGPQREKQGLGLHLQMADNAVEAGIYQVLERLGTGRIRVFTSLQYWQKEIGLYRRDEKGQIIKKDDHLMDCMRYLIMSGLKVAKQVPVPAVQVTAKQPAYAARSIGWMR